MKEQFLYKLSLKSPVEQLDAIWMTDACELNGDLTIDIGTKRGSELGLWDTSYEKVEDGFIVYGDYQLVNFEVKVKLDGSVEVLKAEPAKARGDRYKPVEEVLELAKGFTYLGITFRVTPKQG